MWKIIAAVFLVVASVVVMLYVEPTGVSRISAGGAFMLSLVVLVFVVGLDGQDAGEGRIKEEKNLLENNEIYEIMGVVELGRYGESAVVLRLRSGELRVCRMDNNIPPTKIFKVKKDGQGGINKYEYPPKSLQGKIDIRA